MLKKLSLILLLMTSVVSFAQEAEEAGGSQNEEIAKLGEYLKNLGKYFGYDVRSYCASGGSCGDDKGLAFNNQLLNPESSNMELSTVQSYLNALLGLSKENPLASGEAQEAYPSFSTTFTKPPYNSESAEGVAVSKLLDQKPYRSDPVTQAVLDILSTPGISYCKDTSGGDTWVGCRDLLVRDKVMFQEAGALPSSATVYTGDYNTQWLPELNVNNLISPLMYTTEAAKNPTDSNSLVPSQVQNSDGLKAKTQAQQAANFIRYVSGLVSPLRLPDRVVYDRLFTEAVKKGDDGPQLMARGMIAGYLMQLRSYSAQVSVGISNLYYILSKRIPQKSVSGDQSKSQALDEFKMATWRLFPTEQGSSDAEKDKSWLAKINNASSATTQKEMALLLAEINYQMYLNRQLQERQLLTDSILIFQNAKNLQPQLKQELLDQSDAIRQPNS